MASPEAQQATWRIAVGHEPGYSESWSPGGCDDYDGTPMVRDWLMPLLAEHGFHAYLCGHTHTYERAMVDGVLHIITGGGGASLDEWCRDLDETEVVHILYHYVLVEAGCDKLTLTAYDVENGNVPFDQVELAAD